VGRAPRRTQFFVSVVHPALSPSCCELALNPLEDDSFYAAVSKRPRTGLYTSVFPFGDSNPCFQPLFLRPVRPASSRDESLKAFDPRAWLRWRQMRRSGLVLTMFRVVLGQPTATNGSHSRPLDARMASPHGESGDHDSDEREEHANSPENDIHRVTDYLRDRSGFAWRDLSAACAGHLPAHDGSIVARTT
jgi:hypothetical protein